MADEMLRQRSALWRDIEFNLDGLTSRIEGQKARKCVEDADMEALSSIHKLLQAALVFTRARYRDVLNAQVMEAKDEQMDI